MVCTILSNSDVFVVVAVVDDDDIGALSYRRNVPFGVDRACFVVVVFDLS